MVETVFRIILWSVVGALIVAVVATFLVTFNVKFEYGDLLTTFLRIVVYIVPFGKLKPLFVATISLVLFKIGITILKTIWDIFPLSL